MDPNSFIFRYQQYNSGNECPRNYHIWSALVVLASTVLNRVHLFHGYFNIYPNLYVCLVGKQGSRKSTAKDIARDLLTTTFPDYPVAASVQTREDIVKFMAADECLFSFVDENNATQEMRPFTLFLNELKNFLSFNPGGMIEFLTDIYDRGGKVFNSSTLKRGLENVINPCVNMLACETPDWIIDKLKLKIISGGFSRRVVFVYETERGARISFPTLPPNGPLLWVQMQEHLKKVSQVVGPFTWEQEARQFFDIWYTSLKTPEDDIMEGYYESKHIQLLKLAMLLALAEENPHRTITTTNLKTGIAILDSIETNMPKLSIASGRNELALPMMRVLDVLTRLGGMCEEQTWKQILSKDFEPGEVHQVTKSMQDCGDIKKGAVKNGQGSVIMFITKRKYEEMKKNGEIL